jgi:hypothetical protein
VPEAISSGVRRPAREAEHSFPSNAEVKYARTCALPFFLVRDCVKIGSGWNSFRIVSSGCFGVSGVKSSSPYLFIYLFVVNIATQSVVKIAYVSVKWQDG